MRAGRRAVVTTAFAVVAGLASTSDASKVLPAPVATLRPGQSAFWKPSSGGTTSYGIDVKPGAWRLRVAYDHPDYRVGLAGTLYDPKGQEKATLGGYDSGEAYVLSPMAGRWTLRMEAGEGYREYVMRAKAERRPRAYKTPVMLLPNLRLVPPYEFTFAALLSGGRGVYGGPAGPGSCTADDVSEQHGVRCLRFSVGPANVGRGPLQLVFPGNAGLVTPGTATQIVLWSDGHTTTRTAGTFEYHKTHAHYHHTGFGKLELLKVLDAKTGRTEHAGDGPKQGFCTGDVMIADWTVFGGDQNSADSTCLESAGFVYDPTRGTRMGLSPGWADLYSWEQDGNYVEFGLNTDGRYVVRSTADALHNVLESDETDNTSYAYVQITGSTITVLERGRGLGPWDPHKVIAHDRLHVLANVAGTTPL